MNTDEQPADGPAIPLPVRLSRRDRKKLAKELGAKFVPDAPPPTDDPRLKDLSNKEDALLDMLDAMNALTGDQKPAWFILGPYVFHVNGGVYYHNSDSNMEKWVALTGASEDRAREYLRNMMNRNPTTPPKDLDK